MVLNNALINLLLKPQNPHSIITYFCYFFDFFPFKGSIVFSLGNFVLHFTQYYFLILGSLSNNYYAIPLHSEYLSLCNVLHLPTIMPTQLLIVQHL
jgi:hypothetical protein